VFKPDHVLASILRKWPAVLRAEVGGEKLFPMHVSLGKHRSTSDFATQRGQIEALAAAHFRWRIEWKSVMTRKWGRQRVPVRGTFESAEDLAATLHKVNELTAFRAAITEARNKCPALESWLRASGHRIVEHLQEWESLVEVCAYFDANPQPDCFPRQVPVSAGTKFIEDHAGVLRELLDVVLGDRVNHSGRTFRQRFHLREEPVHVRFRFLDPAVRARVSWPVDDCTVPHHAFADLDWEIPRVLVVENRDVYLCLPEVARTVAVFGSGKAASVLATCRWMQRSDVVYWGDCDEAGYGILSSLRSAFPTLRSILMDDVAWSRWKGLAVPGSRDSSASHSHLTASERAALEAVRAGPWMLEQERIPPLDAELAICAAFSLQG